MSLISGERPSAEFGPASKNSVEFEPGVIRADRCGTSTAARKRATRSADHESPRPKQELAVVFQNLSSTFLLHCSPIPVMAISLSFLEDLSSDPTFRLTHKSGDDRPHCPTNELQKQIRSDGRSPLKIAVSYHPCRSPMRPTARDVGRSWQSLMIRTSIDETNAAQELAPPA